MNMFKKIKYVQSSENIIQNEIWENEIISYKKKKWLR